MITSCLAYMSMPGYAHQNVRTLTGCCSPVALNFLYKGQTHKNIGSEYFVLFSAYQTLQSAIGVLFASAPCSRYLATHAAACSPKPLWLTRTEVYLRYRAA